MLYYYHYHHHHHGLDSLACFDYKYNSYDFILEDRVTQSSGFTSSELVIVSVIGSLTVSLLGK
jgi:hypothetical protein